MQRQVGAWRRSISPQVAAKHKGVPVAQMVFEFGSEGIEPVIRAAKLSIGSSRYRAMTMSTDTDQSLDSQDSLEEAGTKAKMGLLSSITLYPDHPWIRDILIFCPFFAGGSRAGWMGTIEVTTKDYQPLWDLLLRVPELRFVCLGFEEGVDVSEMQDVSVSKFPWDDDFLVLGAVRGGTHNEDGWHIQRGRRYLEAQN
jgi:hypothetical protein